MISREDLLDAMALNDGMDALEAWAKLGPALLAALDERDALMRFAGACLNPWPECLYDLEGDMQERLHKAGLTECRTATEPGDDHDIGDEVYYLSDFGRAAIDAARKA